MPLSNLPYNEWTDEQKERFREYVRIAHGRYNERTRKNAHRAGSAWTPEDDVIINDDNLRDIDKAQILGRTWAAIHNRKQTIATMMAEHGRIVYADKHWYKSIVDTRAESTRRPEKILCACGTVDDDHDEWCPSYQGGA